MNSNTIYFDGKCMLCDHTVQFILKRDIKGVFKFASLQSKYAKMNLPSKYALLSNYNSVILQTEKHIYRKSDVSVQVLKKLSGFYPFLGSFLFLIPKFIRDFGYDLIAKSRFKLFGEKQICGIEVGQRYKSRILS